MRSPFPGMNPYLEHPALWRQVHTRLIVALADAMGPLLYPRYRIAVERRSDMLLAVADELVGIPDLSVGDPAREARDGWSGTHAATLAVPLLVQVPMPEEQIERYLEVRDPIPQFPMPLRPADAGSPVDIGTLLQQVYERGGFDLVVNYHQPPTPALGKPDDAWLNQLLAQPGLR